MNHIDTEPNTELNFEPSTKPDTDSSPERKPSFRRSSIQLDYRLSTYEERLSLVQKTLDAYARAKKPLRQWDYDLLANYLLCGDDAQGTNPVREGYIQLEDGQTGYRPKEQSLEALLESPTFTEQKLNIGPIRYTTPKPKFDRQRYATDSSTSNARALSSTWKSIDHIDRLLRLRANYPIENPTEEELLAAYSLSPQNVYKLKKLLLELRREQYTLGDFVKPQIQLHSVLQSHYRGEQETAPNPNWTFLPLGLRTPARETYFQKPYTLTLQDLNVEPETNSYVVDFRNWTHIYQLNEFREDLEQESIGDPESTVPYIYATLDFYAQYAHLRPAQQLVFQLKAQHYTNEFIARILQEKLGKSYAPAYISTIYTKQVCEGIAQAAQLHYETFLARGNIQLFKACKDCGEILLKDERNFAHSKRCTEGWSCRCKRCESEKRRITKPKPQEEKPK